jgi:hypothetical protein
VLALRQALQVVLSRAAVVVVVGVTLLAVQAVQVAVVQVRPQAQTQQMEQQTLVAVVAHPAAVRAHKVQAAAVAV